jgi:hypothetical protein
MKRPVPVVLTAILLGLFAAFQLLLTVLMIVVGFLDLHKGLPGPPQAPMPFSPAFLPVLFFALSVLTAGVAVWFILTLIGLVRLRSWARYSVLVIAGLMAAFGGMSAVTTIAMPFLISAMPTAANQPPVDAHMMRGVFFVIGAVYGLVAALGVVLLVYFNLARTRAVFLGNAPVSLEPPNTITGKPRPTAITIIAWIYLVSGPFCLLYLFLPYPAFLFGFVLNGMAARLVYVAFGVLTLAIGYGLYRLHNGARLAVFGLFAFCPLQAIVLCTPWGRSQFHAYMDAFEAHMYGAQPLAANPFMSPGPIIFFSILGMAGYGIVLWLLYRHRDAFVAGPPPPALAGDVQAIAG